MSRVEPWDDEPYPNAYALFERAAENAARGKKGQSLLKEIEQELLALPEKRLIADDIAKGGDVCTLGAVAVSRLVRAGKTREEAIAELDRLVKAKQEAEDQYLDGSSEVEYEVLKEFLGIKSHAFAWTIVFENDERSGSKETPEGRYQRMLEWVQDRILR